MILLGYSRGHGDRSLSRFVGQQIPALIPWRQNDAETASEYSVRFKGSDNHALHKCGKMFDIQEQQHDNDQAVEYGHNRNHLVCHCSDPLDSAEYRHGDTHDNHYRPARNTA